MRGKNKQEKSKEVKKNISICRIVKNLEVEEIDDTMIIVNYPEKIEKDKLNHSALFIRNVIESELNEKEEVKRIENENDIYFLMELEKEYNLILVVKNIFNFDEDLKFSKRSFYYLIEQFMKNIHTILKFNYCSVEKTLQEFGSDAGKHILKQFIKNRFMQFDFYSLSFSDIFLNIPFKYDLYYMHELYSIMLDMVLKHKGIMKFVVMLNYNIIWSDFNKDQSKDIYLSLNSTLNYNISSSQNSLDMIEFNNEYKNQWNICYITDEMNNLVTYYRTLIKLESIKESYEIHIFCDNNIIDNDFNQLKRLPEPYEKIKGMFINTKPIDIYLSWILMVNIKEYTFKAYNCHGNLIEKFNIDSHTCQDMILNQVKSKCYKIPEISYMKINAKCWLITIHYLNCMIFIHLQNPTFCIFEIKRSVDQIINNSYHLQIIDDSTYLFCK